MEYLPGRHLDYKQDLKLAAEILADIHNEPISSSNHLLKPEQPIEAIYEESLRMFEHYRLSKFMDIETKETIEALLDKGRQITTMDVGERTMINTELNSGNFLINGDGHKNYLVDWEKPLWGYPAQDLGHFLAPTTTFWKTEIILSNEEVSFFMKAYCKNSGQYKHERELWHSVKNYLAMNCLEASPGVPWPMQISNPQKLIANDYTYQKIKAYLSGFYICWRKSILVSIDSDKTISIIIPVYNEASTIDRLIDNLEQFRLPVKSSL